MRNPKKMVFFLVPAFMILCPIRGFPAPQEKTPMVNKKTFGTTADGKAVDIYTLSNAHGVEARVITYGGILVSLRVPDKNGHLDDVVLGFDSFEGYSKPGPYFGAICGRYANRIAAGKFSVDGKEYTLAKNNGPNSLHGGLKGFDKVVWQAEQFQKQEGVGVILTYTSPDGEEGFPGNLKVKVTYTLTDRNELTLDYQATTDKTTPVNLTNHSYFNLAGAGKSDILGQVVMLNADHFTPVDSTLIPTGKIESVKGTPLDFTKPTAIGARINDQNEQLKLGGGYDHNFVLNRKGEGLTLAARVVEPTSGRVLEVDTTEPGVQLYTGNFLDGTLMGKNGITYQHRYGFCLETQHYPDSPNQPDFPSTILRPGQIYRTRTAFKFSVVK